MPAAPATQETEAEESRVWGQSGKHSEIPLQKIKQKNPHRNNVTLWNKCEA
jgi:hypothetical protein